MRLLLMRHASAAASDDLPDHDRPLSEQGTRDARAIGRWLARHEPLPQLVWCSSALRARQTWSAVASALFVLSDPPDPAYLRSIYTAGPRDLRALLRELPSSADSLLVIGHNPTMAQVLSAVTGESGGFPAGSVAVLDVADPSSDPGTWRLARFATPADSSS